MQKVKSYTEVKSVMSIILGYLAKNEGQLQTSKVNKILEAVGLEESKVDTKSLKEWAEFIENDLTYSDINEQAFLGELNLDNIAVEVYDEESEAFDEENPLEPIIEHPLEDIDIEQVLSPSIKEHERSLQNSRFFRKVQKNGSYFSILMDNLKDDLSKEMEEEYTKEPYITDTLYSFDKNDDTLVVQTSDWHIGAVVQKTGSTYGYDWNIFLNRMEYFKAEIFKAINTFNPKQVFVVQNGDVVEQIYMRNVNQAFETEFDLSEQIAKAYRVTYALLRDISEVKPVIYGSVRGNHDRLQADKKDDIANQNVIYTILDLLIYDQEEKDLLPNVEIIDNREDTSFFQYDVTGKSIYVTHGDGIPNNNKPISNLIRDRNIDMLLTGHIHHLGVNEESYGRLQFVNSSFMGANSYSSGKNYAQTKPSQNIIYLSKALSGPLLYPVYLA